MAEYSFTNKIQKIEFETKNFPEGFQWRTLREGENPFFGAGKDKLGPKECPIHISFFKEAGLRLHFWPLLVDFLIYTKFVLG